MEHDQGIDVQGKSKAMCPTCDTLHSTWRDVKVEWTHSEVGQLMTYNGVKELDPYLTSGKKN